MEMKKIIVSFSELILLYNRFCDVHQTRLSTLQFLWEDNHWPLIISRHKGKLIQTFGVFFVANINKLSNKQSGHWWFEIHLKSIFTFHFFMAVKPERVSTCY